MVHSSRASQGTKARLEDAVVRAVIEHTDGLKLQVDFGHEQTALIEEWQVVKE